MFLEGERVSECFDQDGQLNGHLLLEPGWGAHLYLHSAGLHWRYGTGVLLVR